MEIMNTNKKKRTVLMVTDGRTDMSALKAILDKQYRTILIDNSCRDFSMIKEQSGELSAAVICAEEAAADDFALFEWVAHDSIIAAIPMLIYCGNKSDIPIAEECLKRGAVDIFQPETPEFLVLDRMANSIRLKDSATFFEIEKMLKELPSNICLKDDKGRYIFATHYWHHIDHGDDPEWTIRGKTDAEIRKDKENAVKAMEADMEILRTGKGTQYVIEINSDGKQEFMEVIKRPVKDDSGRITGIIGLINIVTEQELLKKSLEKKALMDELTGVGNRHGFEQYLHSVEISEMLPLCVISADCNELKLVNDTYGHLVGDEYIRISSVLMRTVLPQSRIFRMGGDEFLIVIPCTDEDKAQEYIQKMKDEEKLYIIKDKPISISYGASCMKDPDGDLREHIYIADKIMYRNKHEYKEKIMKQL